MTERPRTKEELLEQIETEWNALLKAFASLPPDKQVAPDEGGWTPKDNLAHIAEWMDILMGYHMDKRPAAEVVGIPEDIAARWDMEEINPLLLERNRGKSVQEVLTHLREVYAKLKAKLSAMTDEDLMAPRHADHPEKGPLMDWILGDTSEHFQEHREVIERA